MPNDKPNTQPMKPVAPKSQTMGLLIALAILMAAGFLVLYFKIDLDSQTSSNDVAMLSQQVQQLDMRVNKMNAPVSAMPETGGTMSDQKGSFPVVAIGREGLLNDDPAERAYIKDHITDPIKDYYNVTSNYIVAIYLIVPQRSGEPYTLNLIDENGGLDQSLFGSRGNKEIYWTPPCTGLEECTLTPAFQAKYPDLIKQMYR